MKFWEKFYSCDCGAEGIVLSCEQEDEENTYYIYMSLFEHYYHGKILSFLERIKWCLQILKNGKPYLDCIVLNTDIAKELGQDLLKFHNKHEAKK